MIDRCFVDTNILLYAISGTKVDRTKKQVAVKVLRQRNLVFSAQVFGEFYVNATRKQRPPLDHVEAADFLQTLLRFPVAEISSMTVFRALEICKRYQLSYWDACIIAAAEAMDCRVIFSEDLQEGQDFGGMLIVNPFVSGID